MYRSNRKCLLCSVVQCIFKFIGACGHVYLLPGSYHSWQGRQKKEEVSLVGSVCYPVPDAAVCQYDDPGRVYTVHPITLPTVPVKPTVLLHDYITCPICKLLHQKAWRKEEELAKEETKLMSEHLRGTLFERLVCSTMTALVECASVAVKVA